MDQMEGVVQQSLSFFQGFTHQAKLPLFELP